MSQESFSASMTTAAWAGDSARRWASMADRIEAQLAPVSDVLLAAAGLRPDERVLDVGCGRGSTTREAAAAVGAAGTVWGLDVSETLLDAARALPPGDGPAAEVTWVLGDGQTHPIPAGSFDVVLSRFGVLFFDDPTEAFANLRRAAAPGGRLCVATWQHRSRSEMHELPLSVALEVAGRHGRRLEPPAPDAGPFSLDGDAARRVLEGAGWAGVALAPHTLDLVAGGGGPVDDAVDMALMFGPLRATLEEVAEDDPIRDEVRSALAEAFTSRHDGTGVRLGAAVNVITATNP